MAAFALLVLLPCEASSASRRQSDLLANQGPNRSRTHRLPSLERRRQLRRPLGGQRLGLLKHILNGSVLQVWRVAILPQQPLHMPTNIRACRLTVHPVDRDVRLDGLHQLMRDDT